MRLLLVAVAATGVGIATAFAAPRPLPMTWQFFTPSGSNVRAIRLAGRVPTTAAGERVTILAKDCPTGFWRQLRITQTLVGGGWEVTLAGPYGKPDEFPTSGRTHRARWRDRWSVPFTYRERLRAGVKKVADGRYRVSVGVPVSVSLARKPVVLQRATESGWANVRMARLSLVAGTGGLVYSTIFVVRQSGLTLRVLVPLKTARPCYNPGASSNFES